MDVVNYLLLPKVLEKANKTEGRPALVNPQSTQVLYAISHKPPV